MLRYCANCKKEFEFSPLAVSGKEALICPECGNIIDKNSRHPADQAAASTEEGLGRAVGWFFRFCYVFYLVLGVLGVIGYVTGIYGLLYAATIISISAYIIQLFTGTLAFTSGVILIPIGAALGYFFFGGIAGACLGVHIVFLARHVLRDIVYSIIIRLVRAGSGPG